MFILDDELLQQAKIQSFAMATIKNDIDNFSMSLSKQKYIQLIAEVVINRLAEDDATDFNNEMLRNYVDKVLSEVSMPNDIKKEVFNLILDTTSFMLTYLINIDT